MRHSKRKIAAINEQTTEQDEDVEQENIEAETTGEANNQEPIKIGNLVACYVNKYSDEEPQIGKITNLLPDNITVQVNWWKGSYADTWCPCKIKKGRKYELWLEEIPISSILYEVHLSRGSRLPEALRKKLKHTYSKI